MSKEIQMVERGGGLFPVANELQTMRTIGDMAVKSGFLPTSIKTPEQAMVILLKGRELGIPPMQAFSSIAVINGKPAMSAELMLSLIYRNIPGFVVDFVTTTATECVIEAQRPGGIKTRFSFTMEDAKRANLAGKGPWLTYPAAMLRARCITAMARAMAPDALSGVVYTPEELGAEVDEDGGVIETVLNPTAHTALPAAQPTPRLLAPSAPASGFDAYVATPVVEAPKVLSEPPKQKFMEWAMSFGWTPDAVREYAKTRWNAVSFANLSVVEQKQFAVVIQTQQLNQALEALKQEMK